MTTINVEQRLLVALLRLGGVVLSTAFVAVFIPAEWMAGTHQWLGLGELPGAPIVDYFARSISALYGFHGVLLLLVSRDPVRYRAIVQFIGVMNIVFGSLMVGIDVNAGMPTLWTLAEGPPIVAFGLVVLYLVRRLNF